jgi:hypothetical protein
MEGFSHQVRSDVCIRESTCRPHSNLDFLEGLKHSSIMIAPQEGEPAFLGNGWMQEIFRE